MPMPGAGGPELAFFEYPSPQKFPDQGQESLILNPPPEEVQQSAVVNGVEVGLDIPFYHPHHAATSRQTLHDIVGCVFRAPAGAKPIGVTSKVSLKDRFQDHPECFLDDAVTNGRNPQGASLSTTIRFPFPYVDSADWTGLKGDCLEASAELLLVAIQVLLPGPHLHAIAACRLRAGVLSDMLVGSPQPVFVIEQTIGRPELMLRLPFRPQTQFPLHFTDIHGSLLPCSHSASAQWKRLQAMGLPPVHSFPVL